MKEENLYSGLWKFSDRVEIEQLAEVADEWAQDEKYLQLYIRKVSKDQNGIGFVYQAENGTKEEYDAFFDRISDGLKRQFGNDLVGWDIASKTYTIKGF
jgi:hypothetical protein